MFHLEILVLEFDGIEKRRKAFVSFKKRTGNLSPYIENDPVPSPLRKSPPFCRPLISTVRLSSYSSDPRTLAHKIGYSERLCKSVPQ